MKQKLFIAGLALAAGLAFNVSKSFSLQGASISEIVSLNTAQASCKTSTSDNGKCSMAGNCFSNAGGPYNCTF